MKKILIPLLVTISTVQAETAPTAENTAIKPSYCPAITEISKNPIKMNWHAHTSAGYWKSYHLSFATNLTQFVGAQWVGENLGQIFCVYQSEQRYTLEGKPTSQVTLPVILAFHTLSHIPTGGKWEHPKRGERLCKSLTQEDCSFTVNMKPPIGDIYREAESLKYQKPDRLSLPIN